MTNTEKTLITFLSKQELQKTPQAPIVDLKMLREFGALKSKNILKTPDIYRAVYTNGTVFEGQIESDKDKSNFEQPINFGSFKFPNGDEYEGPIGMRGNGNYKHVSNVTYSGQFFQLEKYGIGNEIYGKIGSYNGMFRNNMKDGKGIIEFKNGDCYDGNFKNGLRDGIGKYTFANQENLVGDWKKDMLDGTAVLEAKEKLYKGSFIKSQVKLSSQTLD